MVNAGYLIGAAFLQHAALIKQLEFSLQSLVGIPVLYGVLLAIMCPLTILVVTTGMLFDTK